jgi:hypothetical protein
MLVSFAQEQKVVEAMMAAPNMSVVQHHVKIKKESRSALMMNMSAPAGDVEKAIKKFFEDKYDADFKKEKEFLVASNLRMSDVASESVVLMTRVIGHQELSKLEVIVMLQGQSIHEKDHPVAFANVKSVMTSFAKEFYADQYADVLDDQHKELSSEEKTLEKSIKAGEKLVKSINGNESDIQKAENDIVKTEQAIRDAQAKLEQLKADIDNHKNEIEQLKQDVDKNKSATDEQQKVVNEKKEKVNKIQAASDVIRK